jgi:uncharacterized phage protein gp47/JayE
MPYPYPSDQELISNIKTQIRSQFNIPGQLLPESVLDNLSITIGGLVLDQYGYLDDIAKQCCPGTATDLALEIWGNWVGVSRKQAQPSTGYVSFSGTTQVQIPSATTLIRIDGATFITQGPYIIGTTSSVQVVAGQYGKAGNTPISTVLGLQSPTVGVNNQVIASTPFTGGADVETDAAYRQRVEFKWKSPAKGGNITDYVQWALALPGVSRAWCVPTFGAGGIVGLFFMMDDVYTNGFPIGTNGGASQETRFNTIATNDLLNIANAIYPLEPVTAALYVMAPSVYSINITTSGLVLTSSQTTSVTSALNNFFLVNGTPLGMSIYPNQIVQVIADILGNANFILSSPVGIITVPFGQLPTAGVITLG